MQADVIVPWSPGLVIITFGSIIMSGAAEDSFCTVEMNEDAVSEQIGTDGTVVPSQSMNELGMVTVKLMHTARVNAQLLALVNANRLRWGSGFQPITVVDPSLPRKVFAPIAWIAKVPNLDLGKQAQAVEWQIRGAPMRHL